LKHDINTSVLLANQHIALPASPQPSVYLACGSCFFNTTRIFAGMAESLKVVALISGGKDSFFSLLHCLENGCQVVALANLYPAAPTSKAGGLRKVEGPTREGGEAECGEPEDVVEYDLNSFMYQTVGHTVIPLYEQALGIPLYRQQIAGAAVQDGAVYSPAESDETESLVPLLQRIMNAHPNVNAISTGAILSTYQRTRVESVALRLGLTPLGFLWKYPVLPPARQVVLLEDMEDVGLDARIIKVASGGLDESFLWGNVADSEVRGRIEQAMRRFGSDDDGAVLGEGGEFETLVLDGPASLFKGRIEVSQEDRVVVREGGGAAWLRIKNAKVVMKDEQETSKAQCRVPELLDSKFSKIFDELSEKKEVTEPATAVAFAEAKPIQLHSTAKNPNALRFAISPSISTSSLSVTEQAQDVVSQIQYLLSQHNVSSTAITHTTILLHSMSDFATINKVLPLRSHLTAL
jgi:diphthine-ammonia ligase